MAALGTTLMAKVLGHSEAEKAFRPWWDLMEDFMIYGLVMLGLIVIPTAMVMGTSLDCNYCQADNCGKNHTNAFKDPSFDKWWVKKYCTLNGSVSPFMLYFPYLLLLAALILVLIERVFVKVFKAGIKMDKFYSLLIRENILAKRGGEGDQIVESGTTFDSIDGGREALELRQSFRRNDNYFVSYLTRTLLEMLVASIFLAWICYRGYPSLNLENAINCSVHGYWFQCSGQPQQFYLYILYLALILVPLYIAANCFNLLWLIFPCFGQLNRVMNCYRKNIKQKTTDAKTEKELLGDLYNIYFNNRDLRLLLNLLSASSGIAPAIAILTLFDKEFQKAVKPTVLETNWDKETGIVNINFEEPACGVRSALAGTKGVKLMYVTEILPPADKAVLATHVKTHADNLQNVDMEPLKKEENGQGRQAITFTGLNPNLSYSIKVSTVMNGKTIGQITRSIEPGQQRGHGQEGRHGHFDLEVSEDQEKDQQELQLNELAGFLSLSGNEMPYMDA